MSKQKPGSKPIKSQLPADVRGFDSLFMLAQHMPEIRNWKWSNSEGAIQIVVRYFRIEKEIIFIYG